MSKNKSEKDSVSDGSATGRECIDDEPFFSDEDFEDYDDTPVVREPLIREQILIALLGETVAKKVRFTNDVWDAFVNRDGKWSFYAPHSVQKMLAAREL